MTFFRFVVIATVLGLVTGCSSQPRAPAARAFALLQDVNDLLHAAAAAAHRPPAKLADLERFQSQFPRGYEAIQ